ncbi:uncharacterized protein (DUF1330 family) [Roseibium hamelinense]|uniref:Uncharacterized protein (DUF1330 family) n=1 Tax=Roseibium hamelinense TaxID=150831 RepID=A0A562SNG3_9HYPH|nr:DUF1330 domain-containing protein [Roseibium hamelinense]MTI44352.1 DUF1330 domain-containing protein [Roseibium hamelinense]TWI82871.1 uncharacterized protein (DUF1330 family) [Roseibium hamelinense]
MPKAYWIARVDVTDPDAYKNYVDGAAAAFEKFGARFLARGGTVTRFEGEARARNVVIEFKDSETALACFNSPEYQAARTHRLPASEADIILVEGYEGPQPGN